MKIDYTRAMIRAALDGSLAKSATRTDPFFGVEVPVSCASVPDEVLDPRATWADKDGYDRQARKLAGMFAENFKEFENQVSAEVRAVGPLAS